MIRRLVEALSHRASGRSVWVGAAIVAVLIVMVVNHFNPEPDTPAVPAVGPTPTIPTVTIPTPVTPSSSEPTTTPPTDTHNPATEPDRDQKAAKAAVTAWVNVWLSGRHGDGDVWRARLAHHSTAYLASLYDRYDRSLIPATTLRSVTGRFMSSSYGRFTAVLADRTRLVCSVVLEGDGGWRMSAVAPA